MIYGDKEYKENETRIPDINAIMQSSNLYVYCGNNPIARSDPTGQWYLFDDAARAIWRSGAEYYLRQKKGWYLTATLLEMSTNGSGQTFKAVDGEYTANIIKDHSGFRQHVNDFLWENATSKGLTWFSGETSYAFTSGDLGAALHNVRINVTGYVTAQGNWRVNIIVRDTFDFTELKNPYSQGSIQNTFLWVMNDLAYFDQAMGVIDPVEVDVEFWDEY